MKFYASQKFSKCVLALVAVSVLPGSCSENTSFYIVNNSVTTRSVSIELENTPGGSLIFEPKKFLLVPLKGDNLDFAHSKTLSLSGQQLHRIEITGQSALILGTLKNEQYEGSQRQSPSSRKFNLKRIQEGTIEVQKDNFDGYFKKTGYGYAWYLP